MSPRGGLPETEPSLAASARRIPPMGGGRAGGRPLDGARDATMDTSHTLPPSMASSRRAPRWMYALRAAGDRWSRSSDGVSGVVTDGAPMASVETNRHCISRRSRAGRPSFSDRRKSRGRPGAQSRSIPQADHRGPQLGGYRSRGERTHARTQARPIVERRGDVEHRLDRRTARAHHGVVRHGPPQQGERLRQHRGESSSTAP